jgi:hypothetical protein
MDLRKIEWEFADSFHTAQDRDTWRSLKNPVMNLEAS